MTTVRARRRQIEVPNAPPAISIGDELLDVWRLKVAADTATVEYEKARKALHARMVTGNLTIVTVEGMRDRPTVEAKVMQRVMNTVDPVGFRKLVTLDQFMQCAKIGVGDAKAFATETALKAITTESKSAPYIEIRTKGKSGG